MVGDSRQNLTASSLLTGDVTFPSMRQTNVVRELSHTTAAHSTLQWAEPQGKISEGAKGACNHASYCSMLFLKDFLV